MKDIINWFLGLLNSKPEKQNQLQNNEFKNKGKVQIKQEVNSKTINNNIIYKNDTVAIKIDPKEILQTNREYFTFILITFTPVSIISLLQLKLHFFIGSWMGLILIMSILIGLKARKSLAVKMIKFEEVCFGLMEKLESFLNITIPKYNKQGLLFGVFFLLLGVSYLYLLLL